ncbi:MAG: dihydrodipicolinate synthase family protein [Rhizobiaceae bacterium]|nr:dihydrodipicolinate synthase family protein [Rhizobiaceae bacterium]
MVSGDAKSGNMFAGIHAVLYAMFDADEALDMAAHEAQVEYCIAQGCHGITVLGLATEVLKLSGAEREALVAATGQAIGGRVPYSVTIAGNSVGEQVALARAACEAGADWLILQPPMVGNYGADTYLDFFERVASAVDRPVALQNAPQYLGRALSGDDIARLRERCPNVVAVKSEDAALGIRRIVELAGEGMHILGGRGGLEMTDSLRSGCEGLVLAPDIAPVAVRIFELWQDGNQAEAEALYAQATPAITFSMQSLEHLITYGKRIFAAHADLAVHDRAPYLGPSEFGLAMTARWAAHLASLRA